MSTGSGIGGADTVNCGVADTTVSVLAWATGVGCAIIPLTITSRVHDDTTRRRIFTRTQAASPVGSHNTILIAFG